MPKTEAGQWRGRKGSVTPGAAQASPQPPLAFGRYEVQGTIGEGSMGRVYRAYDPMARRVVAIKTLKTEYLTSARGQDYRKRFRREAQAAGNLAHAHIITIFDVGEDYFVMEFLEGQTLREVIQRIGSFDLAEALRVLGPVAEALDYAHGKGVIHRDIKPTNIMLLPDGRPKIMDFGVAHLASTIITSAGEFLGSPSYMAPEQVTSSQASPRTDHFSFAVVSYEMLTGIQPFAGESIAGIVYAIVNTQAPPPTSRNPNLPTRYDEIFRRALAKDPSVRYPSASAFVAALDRRKTQGTRSSNSVVDPPASVVDAPPPGEATPVGDVTTHDLNGPQLAALLKATRHRELWPSRARLLLTLGAMLLVAGLLAAAMRSPGPTEGLAASMAPTRMGAVEIGSDPPGAQVWLDGAEAGRSPLALTSVRPGRHSIQVALPGYSSAELNLDVPAGAFGVPLRFTLQPVSAILQVHSQPEGAAVFVDGEARGTTPIESLSLSPGKHAVELTRDGFAPWGQTVQASAGARIPLLGRLLPHSRQGDTMAHLRSQGWVHEGDFLQPGPDVTPPKRISGVEAPSPESAQALNLRGAVTVEMAISERGEASDFRVVESAGEILDDAVLAAVRTWRFAPAEKNGVKVRTRFRVQQIFGGLAPGGRQGPP